MNLREELPREQVLLPPGSIELIVDLPITAVLEPLPTAFAPITISSDVLVELKDAL